MQYRVNTPLGLMTVMVHPMLLELYPERVMVPIVAWGELKEIHGPVITKLRERFGYWRPLQEFTSKCTFERVT